MTGNLTWHNDRLVHGPYRKEVREEFFGKTFVLTGSLEIFTREEAEEKYFGVYSYANSMATVPIITE